MSVVDCLAKLLAQGKIDARQKREAEEVYNGVFGRLYPTMPKASAEARAAVETASIMEESAKQRRYALAKNAIQTQEALDRIQQHDHGPIPGFLGLLTRDIRKGGGLNVEALTQGYRGAAAKAMEPIFEKYGSKWGGLAQDKAGIRELIHEIRGSDTGNAAAKQLAEGWGALDDYLTGTAKRLGKVFSPAEDWRLPQWWESARVRKFGTEALMRDWRAEVDAGGLKVFDPDTHQEANPIRREQILAAAAEKIAKDLPFEGGVGGAFTNDVRVFRFADGRKGADSYLRLMDKYGAGQGGYLPLLQGHVERAARELAMMHVLGPDWRTNGEGLLHKALDMNLSGKFGPPLTVSWGDILKAPGKAALSPVESPQAAQRIWNFMSGKTSQVGGEWAASFWAGARAFATSRKLGSALLTAIPTDSVNWLMAAKHLGMDSGRLVSEVAKTFVHDTPEAREDAARLGIAAHVGADQAIGTKRFSDQLFGEGFMSRLGNLVIRASGLHAWDMAIRRSFLTEFLGTIASRAGKSFDELDTPFREHFLVPYRFLPEEWTALADPANHIDLHGARFLDPDALAKTNEPLRQKLISALYDERQFAYVVGGSERVRAITHQALAGTLTGELARNLFLFKNFPMTFLSTWGLRAAMEDGIAPKAVAAAKLVSFTTMAGMLSYGAKSLVQGKDWPDMGNPWTWGEAAFFGGAMGIYGDFLREALSRDNSTLIETVAGPLASDVKDVETLVSSERRQLEEGAKVNFGSALARSFRDFTPGNNLWYARLVAQRMIFDQVQKQIDPEWMRSFQRQIERSKKMRNQGFYWPPGETSPQRAPSFQPQ